MRPSGPGILWRAVIFVVFVVAVVVVAIVVPLPTLEELRALAASGGIWAALGFAGGLALASLTPLPKALVSIAAGLVWGLAFGFVIIYAGAVTGSLLALAISRMLGRDAVEKFTGARVARMDAMLRERGLLTMIGVRLVPLIPFTVINYTAGLTSLRLRDYLLGTVIGMIPGTLAYVAVGAYGLTLEWPFFVAMGVLGALALAGALVAVRERKRGNVAAPEELIEDAA